MIALIDYGMGNLRSVQKALEQAGARDVRVTRSARAIRTADKVVLPGVGAIRDCMAQLKELKLIEPLLTAAETKPFLGICLGLQCLFTESEEFGRHRGLNIIPGRVRLFRLPKAYSIPHMGWNQIKAEQRDPMLKGIRSGTNFYFVHSYYVEPKDPSVIVTSTEYGGKSFASSIRYKNIFACQFHPEKSQDAGLHLLSNFVAA